MKLLDSHPKNTHIYRGFPFDIFSVDRVLEVVGPDIMPLETPSGYFHRYFYIYEWKGSVIWRNKDMVTWTYLIEFLMAEYKLYLRCGNKDKPYYRKVIAYE